MKDLVTFALAEWQRTHEVGASPSDLMDFGAWLQRHARDLVKDFEWVSLAHPHWGDTQIHQPLGSDEEA